MGFGGIGPGSLLLLLLLIGIPVLIFGPVAKKAGYSRWWSLLMVLPIVNILVVWLFAFLKWPAEKE